MGHGRHDHSSDGRHRGHDRSGNPIDPVCRMDVDPSRAAGTRVLAGETYFFCSQTCLDAFDGNPAMYAQRQDSHRSHRHAGC